jgi:hypothetical protein
MYLTWRSVYGNRFVALTSQLKYADDLERRYREVRMQKRLQKSPYHPPEVVSLGSVLRMTGW